MQPGREERGPDAAYRHRDRVMAREVEGETVLLDLDGGEYFSLDPVGTRVWELCDGARSPEDIADRIAEEFEVDPATALSDIRELLESMADARLVVAD